MRIIRDKIAESLIEGEQITIKKAGEAEFLLAAHIEVSTLLAEAVSASDAEKFADLLEVVNSCCDIVNIDWYEIMRIKSKKRWEKGSHNKKLLGCSSDVVEV